MSDYRVFWRNADEIVGDEFLSGCRAAHARLTALDADPAASLLKVVEYGAGQQLRELDVARWRTELIVDEA